MTNFGNPFPNGLFDNKLANLDLEVWSVVAGVFTTKVAESVSPYNNTEHLFLTNLPAGEYGFRVVYAGDVWDFVNSTGEPYAVAWNFVPVPEPTGVLTVAVVAVIGLRRAARRSGTV